MTSSRQHSTNKTGSFVDPPGEPFWRHMRLTTVDPLPYYLQLREKYGDYIRFTAFPPPVSFHWYHLTHPSAVEHVLQKHQLNYVKPEFFLRSVKLMAGENLFTAEGDAWLRRRRLYQPVFNRNVITRFSSMIIECCDHVLEGWDKLADGAVIDLHKDITALTLTVVGRALFSSELGEDAHRFSAAVREVLKFVNYKMNSYPFTPPLWFPSARNSQFRQAEQVLVSTVNRLIKQRRERGEKATDNDLLDVLMRARDEETGLGFTDEDVVNEAIILLVAGHDTVSAALSWTFYLLAQHPAEDARFADEISAALRGAHPDLSSVEKLPYTRMIFDESMRLYPPAWGQPRQSIEADSINGYEIPKGSVISLAQWVTHRHPDFWEAPDRFVPERFAPGAVAARPKFAYFPFGGGSRVCIGQHFGLLEGVLLLSAIGQRYRFELAENKPVQPDATFTLIPKNGLKMRLRKRNGGN